MDLNSPLFDRIRVKAAERPAPEEPRIVCDYPGCGNAGEFRAPMGRDREGQYFCFCLDHVRAYNASYNYFNGMSDEAVSRWMKDDLTGHRPTWAMGRGPAAAAGAAPQRGLGNRFWRRPEPEQPRARYSVAALKALDALNLDETAEPGTIRLRYKELVKRLHPDANGGDRSSEDKLREIIHAYKYLRSAKLA
jgi:hypothetical protein